MTMGPWMDYRCGDVGVRISTNLLRLGSHGLAGGKSNFIHFSPTTRKNLHSVIPKLGHFVPTLQYHKTTGKALRLLALVFPLGSRFVLREIRVHL
jgi:hypothetical protein